jgi:hypothetical protein
MRDAVTSLTAGIRLRPRRWIDVWIKDGLRTRLSVP